MLDGGAPLVKEDRHGRNEKQDTNTDMCTLLCTLAGRGPSQQPADARDLPTYVFVYMCSMYVCEHVLCMYAGQPPRRSPEVLARHSSQAPQSAYYYILLLLLVHAISARWWAACICIRD